MKKILLTSENTGRVMEFDAKLIAMSYAKYYATTDTGTESELDRDWIIAYNANIDVALNSEDELLDWAMNNMDWSDVEPHAKLVQDDPIGDDFASAWSCSDNFEVVEEENVSR